MNFYCFLLFWESSIAHNLGTTVPIQVEFSAKCTCLNEDFNQIENWKCHMCNFRLIPLDRITYCKFCFCLLSIVNMLKLNHYCIPYDTQISLSDRSDLEWKTVHGGVHKSITESSRQQWSPRYADCCSRWKIPDQWRHLKGCRLGPSCTIHRVQIYFSS